MARNPASLTGCTRSYIPHSSPIAAPPRTSAVIANVSGLSVIAMIATIAAGTPTITRCRRSEGIGGGPYRRRRSVLQMAFQDAQVGRREAVGGVRGLVPERVRQRRARHRLDARDLVVRQLERGGGEVVRQLVGGARADDDRRDARASEQPRQRDLRGGHAMRL